MGGWAMRAVFIDAAICRYLRLPRTLAGTFFNGKMSEMAIVTLSGSKAIDIFPFISGIP